jgi:hypothetical protein
MGLARHRDLVYAPRVRHSILLVCLVAGALVGTVPAAEQTIEQLAPAQEERVEAIGQADDVARVDPMDPAGQEDVAPNEAPGPIQKAATTVGKVVLGVVSAAVAVGVMVASLLLL